MSSMNVQEKVLRNIFQDLISLKDFITARRKESKYGGYNGGFIRTQIAKTVNLRITPQLVFEFDDSIEYGMKIDSILKEINANETNN